MQPIVRPKQCVRRASRAPAPPAPPRIMASEALALVSGAGGGGSAPPPTSPVLTCEENQRLRIELRETREDLSQVLKERAKLRTALEKAEGENYQLKIKLWEAEHQIYQRYEVLRMTEGERQLLQVKLEKAEGEMQRLQEALRHERWMRTVEAAVARILQEQLEGLPTTSVPSETYATSATSATSTPSATSATSETSATAATLWAARVVRERVVSWPAVGRGSGSGF